MADIVFPFTLTAGANENVNQLNSNLSAITDQFNGNIELDQLASALQAFLVPTGTILATGRATAPTGYLLCDGSAVSRSTYSDLFAAIDTAYGTGDGSTTFNVPDLRGNVPVGKDASTFAALGDTGGEETHTLTKSATGAQTTSDSGTPGLGLNAPADFFTNQVLVSSNFAAHNNLQPYQVVNYMIKV